MESNTLAIVLILAAALIPIAAILLTMRAIRKKRARGNERSEDKTFTSVKEERLRKRGDL
ncbi:hypothetical protein [Cesiribacter andamanensis]|uniref:Uncharacterized protein n=1 Tax=Cesiribacter andamanensis AMV16 TaxID=1279009 RepID=M7NA86_9BACT|nr:hypothetical protein [Cesiribacter andamanensis]EMR04116.1 hypothetical protein ADICEAN_00739 [Cesiribacter andamanensis AMV16]